MLSLSEKQQFTPHQNVLADFDSTAKSDILSGLFEYEINELQG